MSLGKLIGGMFAERLLVRTAEELRKPTRELIEQLPEGVQNAIRTTKSVAEKVQGVVPGPLKLAVVPVFAVIPIGPVSAMTVAQVVNTLFFDHDELDSPEPSADLSEAM